MRQTFSWSGWGRGAKAIATFATLATGLAAIGALYITNQTLDATRQQTALSEQGQYTDRFGRAVEQLGSDKTDIRLGGIYALERLATDSPRDATTITRLLGAYVRENTPCPTPPAMAPGTGVLPRPATDVAAALTVLSARDFHQTVPWADVTGACLSRRDLGANTLVNLDLDRAKLAGTNLFATVFRGVRLQGADLSDTSAEHSEWLGVLANSAQLSRADLGSAFIHNSSFAYANLTGAHLDDVTRYGGRADDGTPYADASLPPPGSRTDDGDHPSFFQADLSHASIDYADLPEADFGVTQLEGASFRGSKLQRANFTEGKGYTPPEFHGYQVDFEGADLSGARFRGRDMRRMNLIDTNLAGADLGHVDLRGVDLRRTNLTGADLTGANLTGALR